MQVELDSDMGVGSICLPRGPQWLQHGSRVRDDGDMDQAERISTGRAANNAPSDLDQEAGPAPTYIHCAKFRVAIP
jgi:hypothetical protein